MLPGVRVALAALIWSTKINLILEFKVFKIFQIKLIFIIEPRAPEILLFTNNA